MTTRNFTLTELPLAGADEEAWVAVWTGLVNGDDGAPLELAGFRDRSVQVVGTFGAGGNLRVEGSNNSTDYAVLRDPSHTALDITAASVKTVLEATRKIRPRVTAGDGTTALVVSMYFARTKR